jgi:hypothetical protein
MQGACDERFRVHIDRLGARAIEESEAVIYGLWKDFTLAYTNPSWARFAVENDASDLLPKWGLGRSMLDACGPELLPFYESAFRRVFDTGEPFVHEYACHAPELRRWYVMRALPVTGDALLVSHALVVRRPNDPEDGASPSFEDYHASDGWIRQCPHCRRVRAVASATPNRWDFVPQLLDRGRAMRVTHTMCSLCFGYHYHQEFTPDELRLALNDVINDEKRRR